MRRRRRSEGGLFTRTGTFLFHKMRCGYGLGKCWGQGGLTGPFKTAVGGGGNRSTGGQKLWWGYGLAFYRGEGREG